jgi:uncharacterized protein YndB with AHSA1/START domain
MAEIFHELPIRSSPENIYQAVTDEEVISRWWLPDSKIKSRVGERGVFPLSDGENKIVMQVEQLIPNQRVVWKCLDHKFPEWKNTNVTFEVLPGSNEISTLRFRHSGWANDSGVFAKTSFYWASLYLRNLKQTLEQSDSVAAGPYDWSKFEIFMYVQSSIDKVYRAWATSSGMESFFIKEAAFIGPGKNKKSKDEFAETGDQYEWLWWHNNYRSQGKVLKVQSPKEFSFSFGSSEVHVNFAETEHGTQIHLVQDKIQINETEKVHTHLDCRSGWIYFLCNLKAALDFGVDIRQRNSKTEGCVSVRFPGNQT